MNREEKIFNLKRNCVFFFPDLYPFSKGNPVNAVGSIPTCRLLESMVEECVKSSEILSQRITMKERTKGSGERKESAKEGILVCCGSVGVRQNCE